MFRKFLIVGISCSLVASLSGCISTSTGGGSKNSPTSDPYVNACNAFRGFTKVYISGDFAGSVTNAQETATEFGKLSSGDPSAAVYAEVMKSIVRNKGKYADDLTAYSELLSFCKQHPAP